MFVYYNVAVINKAKWYTDMAIPDGYRVIKKTDVLSSFIAVTVKRETDVIL